MSLTLRYAAFALLSIAINILTQEASLAVYTGSYAILVSVLAGTATGLISKYLLDKHFIFQFRSAQLSEDLKKFVIYSGTGVVTTAIFWGFEFGFEYLFGTKMARYTGAVIGLSIGYFIKYRLDRRYVFSNRSTAC